MASQDWFEKDFYAILGVAPDADAATIKKTYRKVARSMHPDHNVGDPKAEERFKEVGEAYAVLSDPEKRREYDAIRAMSHGGARFTAGGAGGPGARFEGIFSPLAGAGGARVARAPVSRTSSPPSAARAVPVGSACASTPAAPAASPTSRTSSARCSAVQRPAPATAATARRPVRAPESTSRPARASASATPSRARRSRSAPRTSVASPP